MTASCLHADLGEPSPDLLIAHALGAVGDVTYSNSAEALERSYGAGRRWFEVDLALTADGDLVCFHYGCEQYVGLTADIGSTRTSEFLRHRFLDRFTLIGLGDVLRWMGERPDVVLVTDTKRWDAPVLAAFERTAAASPRSVRRRLVPQFYRPEELAGVRAMEQRLGRFPFLIFTLYQIAITDDDVVAFVARERIPLVTASSERFNRVLAERLHAVGARIFVHTVNDSTEIATFRNAGADGIYTDQ